MAIIDLGLKTNILTSLTLRKGDLYIFPHNATHDDIFGCEPDCLFVTNGPGDPKQATISTGKRIIGELPIFGICMGNQSLPSHSAATPTSSSSGTAERTNRCGK